MSLSSDLFKDWCFQCFGLSYEIFKIEGLMIDFVLILFDLSSDLDWTSLGCLIDFMIIDSLFFFQISSFSHLVLFFLYRSSSYSNSLRILFYLRILIAFLR